MMESLTKKYTQTNRHLLTVCYAFIVAFAIVTFPNLTFPSALPKKKTRRTPQHEQEEEKER